MAEQLAVLMVQWLEELLASLLEQQLAHQMVQSLDNTLADWKEPQ
jgi:predicted HAD superfamily phosphohydrolase YqeG